VGGLTPSITTLDRNTDVLAEKACEALLQVIDGNKAVSMETVVPVSLIERDSTR
jgi:LacI family transcriptional regulator